MSYLVTIDKRTAIETSHHETRQLALDHMSEIARDLKRDGWHMLKGFALDDSKAWWLGKNDDITKITLDEAA